ncbi:MAG: ABC transporter ATP-binding protein [Kocuria sp.]|nr:ABC transporter ATP-binding protein [Kocuria sp.]MDO5618398.1 ABC transporter ATP-binding protein [Kocuria sp.]
MFAAVPWRMRGRIILMFLAALASALLDLVAVAMMLPLMQLLTDTSGLPGVVQQYLVPVVGTDDQQTLLIVTAALVGLAFLVKNIVTIALRWWSVGEAKRASAAVQAELLASYTAAPYSAYRQRSKASMTNAVTVAVPATFDLVLTSLLALMVDAVSVVLLLGMLLVFSPGAALAAFLIFGGFSLLISRVLKPYSLKYAHRNFVLGQESFGYIHPAIEGFREMKLFGREALFTQGFKANRQESAGLSRFQVVVGELPKYLLEVVMILGILAVAIVLFATQDTATAFGLLAVFAAAAMRIVPALNRAVASINLVRSGSPSLARVAEELQALAVEASQDPSAREATVVIPQAPLEVRDVGFTYPDAQEPVLSNVSITIEPGQTIALVGGSGAGKTTFADILAGLYLPTEGSITVGGVDIVAHPRSWRNRVGMVSQRVYLWDASVRDLVTFGQPLERVDHQLLADVLKRSQLADVVAALPDGLDTRVGDQGARLSGGQTQRLGIARALYSQPDVLILDEATSALDNHTERQITDTISGLRGSTTVIVIAHRLSTVKDADSILFFSRGKLAAQGSMAELYAREPEFASLVDLGTFSVDPPSADAGPR